MAAPNSSEWLYGAAEPGLPYPHYVIGTAKSKCVASYGDDMSTRIYIEDPATDGTIEDYFDTSIDGNAQDDLCNAFPELQNPKYGISETRGGENLCVPQSTYGIDRITTHSTAGNLWIGMQESASGGQSIFEENSDGTEKYTTWSLVIAHVNDPGGGLNASADFRMLVCAEPPAALNDCLTSFDYFLREAVAEDKINDFSLDGTISNIQQYVHDRIPADSATGKSVLKVYIDQDQSPLAEPEAVFRPTSVQIAGDGTYNLEHMTWQTWTGTQAVGTGTAEIDDCNPACANGKWYYVPVKAVFSQPIHDCIPTVSAGSDYFWSQVDLSYPSGLPKPVSSSYGLWKFSDLVAQADQDCAAG
jgi:hypothetical protein